MRPNYPNPPRPYDLSKPEEFGRLFVELRGYMQVSLKNGTDREGREYALQALKHLVKLTEDTKPERESYLHLVCLENQLASAKERIEELDAGFREMTALAHEVLPQNTPEFMEYLTEGVRKACATLVGNPDPEWRIGGMPE